MLLALQSGCSGVDARTALGADQKAFGQICKLWRSSLVRYSSSVKRWWLLVALFGSIIVLWLGYGWWLTRASPLHEWTQRGLFGDMFGGLNALFSGLALAGIIYALRLQMEELALQREEMSQSRDELKRTADAQSHQVQLLARQVAAMEEAQRAERERRQRQAEPQFRFTGAPEIVRTIGVGLENHGAQIADLAAESRGDYDVELEPTDLLGTRQILKASVKYTETQPKIVEFILLFTDIYSDRRKVIVHVDLVKRRASTLPFEGSPAT